MLPVILVRSSWPAFLVVMLLLVVSGAAAQSPKRALTGRVVDPHDRPITDVLVFVGDGDEPRASARTGADGTFRLEGLAPGTDTLRLRREGFAPRSVPYSLQPNRDGQVETVVLEAGPAPTATFGGTVRDADGNPLFGAEVRLNDEAGTLSDQDGRFAFQSVPVRWGRNLLRVRHLSYADAERNFWVGDPDATVRVDVTLRTAPVEVAGVVADGIRRVDERGVIPGFGERRSSTNGYFLERSEIRARDAGSLTEVVRSAPGLRIRQLPGGPELSFSRRTRSLSPRDSLSLPGDRCRAPIVFLDGTPMGNGRNRYTPIDDLVRLDDVAGIEVYNGASRIPTRFNRMGSGCGVIAIWTTRSLIDPGTSSRAVGGQLGQLGPDMGEDASNPSGTSVGDVVMGSTIVGAVAVLLWKAVCAQPHFCR